MSLKVGLALGGGAARGLAHIGLIEVLEQNGVKVDLVAGTSMGALVGSLYCIDGAIAKVADDALNFLRSPQFKNAKIHRLHKEDGTTENSPFQSFSYYIQRGRVIASTMTRSSALDVEDLYELLGFFVDDRDIKNLKIPFHAIATDLVAGEQVILEEGPVIDAVAASSAVPGAFPPIKIGDRLCVDGGIINMVPVSEVCRMGADYVIAANVIHDLPIPGDSMKALEIYFRSHQITKLALTDHHLRFADVILSPDVGKYHWADFSQFEQCIEAGRAVARQYVDKIVSDIKRLRRTPRFLRRKTGAALFRKYMNRPGP
jgi:NTE family protein